MKKMLLVMCVIGLAASGAMAYPGPNSIGIYMDAEAASGPMQICTDQAPFQQLDLYLLISGPTGTQVAAWEAQVHMETTVGTFGDWSIPTGGINVGWEDYYIVGHGASPLQPNGVGNIVLMTLGLVPTADTDSIVFYIRPIPDSTQASPGYAEDVGIVYQLYSNTGGPDTPVFIVNGTCDIVSNNDMTWGGVKALY